MWRDPVYDALIRELLAQEVLVARDAVPVRLPPHRFDFAEQEGEVWIDWIKGTASTWSVTWTTSARAAPPRTRSGRTRTGWRAKLELGAALDALSEMTQEAASRASTDTVAGRLRGTARRLRDR